MVLARKPQLVFLLCSSIVLIAFVKFRLSRGLNLVELCSSPLLSFSVLNVIIFAIIWLSAHDPVLLGENPPLVLFVRGDDAEGEYISSDSDEDDGCFNHGFDGYDEDDDDSGSDEYELGWDEEEEEEDYDPELQRRIEGFIEKVVEGWRRERFEEMFGNKSDDYPP